MKTLYIEGVAIHDGPESRVDVRKGGDEALTGVRAGQPLSREIEKIGVPTLSRQAEGHIVSSVIRELLMDSARSENLCMYGVSMRENREIPRPSDWLIAWRDAQARPRPQS